MTKEKHLKQYEALVERNEKAAASMEHSAQSMVSVVKAEREIVKHQYKLIDGLEEAISGVNELSKGFAVLLNRTSIKLMSKNIHQLIDEYQTEQENGRGFEPGVPRKILNGVDK